MYFGELAKSPDEFDEKKHHFHLDEQREFHRRYSRFMQEKGIVFRREKIKRQKYYAGFAYGREKKMFEEELNDLENVYQNALDNVQDEIDNNMPMLVRLLKGFLSTYEQKEILSDKLENLREKMGKNQENEND